MNDDDDVILQCACAVTIFRFIKIFTLCFSKTINNSNDPYFLLIWRNSSGKLAPFMFHISTTLENDSWKNMGETNLSR